MKVVCLQTLAQMVTEEDLNAGRIYPPLKDIKKCSLKIAAAVATNAYKTGETFTLSMI